MTMAHYQVIFFSASIFAAAIPGALKFNKIDSSFFPFIFCVWLAALNETISFIITLNKGNTALNNNIYVLCEALLFTWQFKNWGLFNDRPSSYKALITLFIATWALENLFTISPFNIKYYFRIIYSMALVFMSIHQVNKLILDCRAPLLKEPIFLICAGIIIYFTYKILVESFWLYGLSAAKSFRNNVYLVSTWINLFVNLIFSISVLCIPLKKRSIIHLSLPEPS